MVLFFPDMTKLNYISLIYIFR